MGGAYTDSISKKIRWTVRMSVVDNRDKTKMCVEHHFTRYNDFVCDYRKAIAQTEQECQKLGYTPNLFEVQVFGVEAPFSEEDDVVIPIPKEPLPSKTPYR